MLCAPHSRETLWENSQHRVVSNLISGTQATPIMTATWLNKSSILFQVAEGGWSPEGPIVAWDVAGDRGIVGLEEASNCPSRHSRQAKALLLPPALTLPHPGTQLPSKHCRDTKWGRDLEWRPMWQRSDSHLVLWLRCTLYTWPIPTICWDWCRCQSLCLHFSLPVPAWVT